jgi:signal transduction histidine kinase
VRRQPKRAGGTGAGFLPLPKVVSRNVTVLLLFLVFAVEAGLGILVAQDLLSTYGQAEQIYTVSVQGLHRIGELQYETQETRRSTLYALTTNDGNLQVEYADQSRAADRRVSQEIQQYLEHVDRPREMEAGQRLAHDWNDYLKVRDEVLALILESSVNEAVRLDLTSGVPLFDRVRDDVDEIKRLFDERASQQLALVSRASRRSLLRLMAGLTFALLLGSLAISAIQRNKMRSEMQLAKLQMDFVASISHELKTPITAILCAGENIRDGFAADRKELRQQGAIVVDQGTQLAGLVNQVLLFATTTEKPMYNLRPLEVSDIVENAIKNTAVLLEKSDFTVERQIARGLPPVLGDLAAMSQCLQNLIANAVKYSSGERRMRVTAGMGESSSERKEVQISVEDQGPGISSSDIGKIFEPFYRSPGVVDAQIHGTGLGLSNTRSLIEAMGGRVSVASAAGQGSTFTLHVPTAERDARVVRTRPARENGVL